MKKIFISILFIFIFIFSATKINASADSLVVTINKSGFDANYGTEVLKSGDQVVPGNTITITKGETITINATPNEGYRITLWVIKGDTNSQVIRNSGTIYDGVNLNYKPAKSITITPHYAKVDDCYGLFEDNSGNVLDYQVTKVGGDFEYKKGPNITARNFTGWSDDLTGVITDMVYTPEYSATIASVWRDYSGLFLQGLLKTLLFSVISVFCALFLGFLLCILKGLKNKVISFIASAYIEIIRGVPLLLQLLLIYALMPRIQIGVLNTEIIACLITLFINSSAYLAEIFRAGIQAVDNGQMEAARSLGLSKKQAMVKVIIPQAIKNVLPSIGNELIMVIKETSLASSIDMTIGELMSVKNQITAATYINIEPYIIVAIIYFIVTFTLSKVVGLIERRLATRD